MKHNLKFLVLTFSFLIISYNSLIAQNPKWSRNGDNISNGDWLGSTNNEPLLLKANNNLGIKIKPNGQLIFKSLDLNSNSGPNGLVFTDGQGLISRFDFTGNSTDYLLGNGTWGTLPVMPNSWSVIGNHIFSSNSGNVGIGTSNPLYKLDVIGDVRVSNNLFVGGGIIITDVVNATDNVNTGALTTDTIHMTVGGVITGTATFSGEIKGSDKLKVDGGVAFNNTLSVLGNSNFQSEVNIGAKLHVGNGNDKLTMKYVPGTSTYPAQFKFSAPGGSGPIGGPPGSGINPEDSQPDMSCFTGVIPGFANVFSQLLSVAYYPSNPSFSGGQILMGHDGINAFIDTQGSNPSQNSNSQTHPGDLLINPNCNRNVLFFKHTAPFATSNTLRVVSIDGSLNVRSKMQLGDLASNFTDPFSKLYVLSNVGSSSNGIKVKHGAAGNVGIKIATYNDALAFVVSKSANSTQDGIETFKIEGDGRTTITTTSSVAFSIMDAANANADNFHINTSGQTFIGNPLQTNGSMFTVSQPNKNAPAFVLTDNSTSPNKDFFSVQGNGYTEIKFYTPPSIMPQPVGGSPRVLTIKDMVNNKDVFVVNSVGKVSSREVEINLIPTFPDYVFSDDYKLKTISEVDAFIKTNKHLPGFEKGEYYEKNGINVSDIIVKQQEKMEEMMLYIIELENRLKNLESNKQN